MILRVDASSWAAFVSQLTEEQQLETAGVILAQRLGDSNVLVARSLAVVPKDAYEVRRADQLRLHPIAINRMIRPARDRGWSVFTVHTHPGAVHPWFSDADDRGDARLMPSFHSQIPAAHGSMVVAAESGHVLARVWETPRAPAPLPVHVVGEQVAVPRLDPGAVADERFARQELALGAEGQARLAGLHVGVVGLGGTGSVAFALLTHLGVGQITAIDGDLVEASNLPRILSAVRADVGQTMKVDVASRYAARAGFGTRVNQRRGMLGREASLETLAGCDVVLSCVDKHTPRALLNRFSYDALVPVIDMGSSFRVDGSGIVVQGSGRVVTIGPGRPCLACWGHIDPERLRAEATSEEELARLGAEGYVDGADVPQPSVIAFNGQVASAAVTEMLRIATGFSASHPAPRRLAFDFLTGVVRRNTLAAPPTCRICGGVEKIDESYR